MPWKEICAMDQKMQMIKYWKGNQLTITDLSLLHDVSRKTIYKWIKRYKAEGPTGLEERSRAPLRHPNAIAPEIIDKIITTATISEMGTKEDTSLDEKAIPGRSVASCKHSE